MIKTWRTFRIWSVLLAASLQALPQALANGKKRKPDTEQRQPTQSPIPKTGQKLITLPKFQTVKIEMPNDSWHDFGNDFQSGLITRLVQSGKYQLVESQNPFVETQIRIQVQELSFVTGSRGNRMFYGFDDRFRTPFNDGSGLNANEFPLQSESGRVHWLEGGFNDKGTAPFNSRSGLDLGEGLNINLLFAWLELKYAQFRSELALSMEINSPLLGYYENKKIRVSGKGYFYDIVAGYDAYSVGIRVARYDAMLQAMKKAITSSYASIENSLKQLPATAWIFSIVKDEKGENLKPMRVLISLGGAPQSPQINQLYQLIASPEVIFRVLGATPSGLLSELYQGNPDLVKPGLPLREIPEIGTLASTYSLSAKAFEPLAEQVNLPEQRIEKADFGNVTLPYVSAIEAYFRSLIEAIFLPYRIWRYNQYDQSYKGAFDRSSLDAEKDSPPEISGKKTEIPTIESMEDWKNLAPESHIKNLSEPDAIPNASAVSIVAVIDSGVDYNHPQLKQNLWINPKPYIDIHGKVDWYGWDFISGDSRPFDDSYHGTRMASAVLSVAPRAQVMPLKVFNPWGVTSSAALYASIVYAVDHGAKIILCGWATTVNSIAIEAAARYALDNRVILVTAAGDRGRDLSKRHVYPASLARLGDFPNILAVAGVNSNDELLRGSNYDPDTLSLAAPGSEILVAEPRKRHAKESSSGVAAALVAGALANIQQTEKTESDPLDWIDILKKKAEPVPKLRGKVRDGLRLKLNRLQK